MIRILTYNIHKGFDRYNRDFVLHRIRDYLQNTAVDIVLLQEIHGHHQQHQTRIANWPNVSQFEFLADSIWPHHAYGKNAIYRKGHHGNAILSKFNILDWNNLNLSRFQWASRSLLHGKLEIPEMCRPLHLLCVHMDLLGFERRRQLRDLSRYIDSNIDPRDPLIIGGDFNDWSGSIGRALESQLGMREAYQQMHGKNARTFPSNRPILCMDRIYFRGIKLLEAGCHKGKPWSELSDHLPLHADFSLE
jgi:endonuclease/exonuclease/phosphatase family metal-dependent hydrolase